MWRTPGEYTGATPVAWRTDRWTAINQGTTTVTYKEGKLPGQKVHWGIRYANWVVLQGIDGHVVSVISAHLPPENEITEGLQRSASTTSARSPTSWRPTVRCCWPAT